MLLLSFILFIFVSCTSSSITTEETTKSPADWFVYFEDMDFKYKGYESILYGKRTEFQIIQMTRDLCLSALRKSVGHKIDTAGVRAILDKNPASESLYNNLATMTLNLKNMNKFNSTIVWEDINAVVTRHGIENKVGTIARIVVHFGQLTLQAHREYERDSNDRKEIKEQILQNIPVIEPVYVNQLEALRTEMDTEVHKMERLRKLKENLRIVRKSVEAILNNLPSTPAKAIKDLNIRRSLVDGVKAIINRATSPSLNDMNRMMDGILRESRLTARSSAKPLAFACLETVDQLIQHAEKKEQEGSDRREEITELIEEFSASLTQINLYKNL